MSRPEWDCILSAAQKNNAREIERLVDEEGVDPNHANVVKQSALHVASLWGNVEAVKTLLSKGANSHAQNTISGGTPLHSTVQSSKQPASNRVQCAKLLINSGADPNKKDNYDATPSDYLNNESNTSPASGKFQFGGLGSAGEYLEYVKSMQAVLMNENLEKQMQLKATEHITSLDGAGLSAFLNGGEFKEVFGDGGSGGGKKRGDMLNTLLLHTVLEMQLICETIGNDAEKEQDEEDREEMLESAKELVEIIKFLLRNGASAEGTGEKDKNNKLDMSKNPMHIVCSDLTSINASLCLQTTSLGIWVGPLVEQVATMLKDNGATLHTKTEYLMHDAARRGYLNTIQFWIETLGMDKDVKGRQEMTALHFAARSGKVEIVRYLLSMGAERSILDSRGKTALDAATANGKQDIVALLEG